MKIHSVYLQLTDLIKQSTPCALATVISSGGSTPQVPGSSALFGAKGVLAGTIGGGPAEYRVKLKSAEALLSGRSEILTFDMAGQLQHGSDSICGGSMVVLLDLQPLTNLTAYSHLNNALAERKPGVLVTFIEENEDKTLHIKRLWCESPAAPGLPDTVRTQAEETIQIMLSSNAGPTFQFHTVRAGREASPAWLCLEKVAPPPSLVIAGAGHVGKALVRMGKFLGFEVTVWDDRSDFANPDHIPEADHHFSGPFADFMDNLKIDHQVWLVIVTRGHQYDAEVLRQWIRTVPAYLGMMGSRSKIAQMRQQFLEEGWATEEQWNQVHTPVGLKIGAKTVEEIAVSIAAELVMVKNLVTQGYTG